MLVFTPAFVADCLETTIEISHEYQEEFVELGGECLDLVASCNDSETWVRLLEDVVRDNVSKYWNWNDYVFGLCENLFQEGNVHKE